MTPSTTLITKDFEGHPIVFREDGYINMTKAAKQYGKKLSNFWDSPETKEYVDALAEIPGIQGNDLLVSKRGNGGGSWCHPKLAVFFARWLDVRFAVWCDLMLDNILRGSLEVSVVEPTEEALMLSCCRIPDRSGLTLRGVRISG